jgi:hypothetical protein
MNNIFLRLRRGTGILLATLLVTSTFCRPADLPVIAPRVQLDAENAGPREIEEQTEKAIVRDYGAAWTALNQALERNQPEPLGDLWVGTAKQLFLDALQQQEQSGIRIRYLGQQHQLQAVFYSQEGSALELQDTAQVERQVLDGETVVNSESLTLHYLVVMTPTTDHWQVRIFQSVADF